MFGRVPGTRPNISESHSETRVLEYPFSTTFRHTKGYLRVLGGGRTDEVLYKPIQGAADACENESVRVNGQY